MPSADPDSQVVVPTPLSVSVRSRGAANVSVAAHPFPIPGSKHEEDVLSVLYAAVDHYGIADPSRLQRYLWMSLDGLLRPKALKPFVQYHARIFEIVDLQQGTRRWGFRRRSPGPPSVATRVREAGRDGLN